MSGFITMSRDALDHPLFRNGERFRAWFWMVAKACWKPARFDIAGKIVTLERGQFCTSRAQLAAEWGWSPSAVERYLTRLETGQLIGRATGQGRTVITICNYSKYQGEESEAGQATGQAIGQQSDSKRKREKEERVSVEVRTSPLTSRAKPQKVLMSADWRPEPLPPDLAALVALWPPGTLETETDDFREYWQEDGTRRPGWDRTWRSRIRMIHNRIIKDSRNGRSSYQQSHTAPSGRVMGRTEAAARAVLGQSPVALVPARGVDGIITLPHAMRS